MSDTEHKCFTVSSTAYLRNLTREEMNDAVAVHYQAPPRKTEGGTCHSLNFPLLVIAGFVEDPEGVAEKVAAILNEHWEQSK
tara:strand:+ start:89 stop:334 length:246 start_codon:yes stop_codon:yes gene_type:complete